MAQQVKFWVYITCPVLLTLRKGQTLNHSHGGRTDEGYSWEANSWHFDGQTVYASSATEARDCDGRISRESNGWFPLQDAKAGYRDEDGTRFPMWRHGQSSQRDHAAEAMGY